MRKKTNDEILLEFKDVHGDKYDYSKVKYDTTHKKVLIICKDHGEFWQTPSKHKSGNNCPKCVGGVKLSQEEIIKEFKLKHGNKYDYSLVKYKNSKSKIKIICKTWCI